MCQNFLEFTELKKENRVIESKQISTWLVILPIGLWDLILELKVHHNHR